MFPTVSTKTTPSDRNRNQCWQVELNPVKCCDPIEQLWGGDRKTGQKPLWTTTTTIIINSNCYCCCCISDRNFSLDFSLIKGTVITELTQYPQCEYKYTICWLPELSFQQSINSKLLQFNGFSLRINMVKSVLLFYAVKDINCIRTIWKPVLKLNLK